MKTVFGWSDGGSACEYYRLRVPLEHLTRKGLIDARFGGHFQTPQPDVLPDVVIGQRINRPEPATMWRMMHSGQLGSRPWMIYELDDDLFHVPEGNPVHGHFSRPSTQQTILDCMSVADVITVSTQTLANVVRERLWGYGATVKRIEVIPNALPLIAYRHERRGLNFSAHRVVGWAGSSTHRDDFDHVAPGLAEFLRRKKNWKFLAVGTLFPSVRDAVRPAQREHARWVRDMGDYYRTLDRFDVGIVPVEDNAFNRSKSDLKFLEYSARRVPVIASDCGPYAVHNSMFRSMGVRRDEWCSVLRGYSSAGWNTDAAFEYAWSRRVDSVERKWLEVIDSGQVS